MAKCRTNGKKKNGIVMLKIVVEKLQKSLLFGRKNSSDLDEFDEDMRESKNLQNDVKEGHFAVIAVDDDELKRFIVPLSYLTHPSFLRLLEQAAEEYGFDHEGALTIPCRPSELEHLLAEPGADPPKVQCRQSPALNFGWVRIKASSHYILGWSFKLNGIADPLDVSQFSAVPAEKSSSSQNKLKIALLITSSVVLFLLVLALISIFAYRKLMKFEVLEDWELDCPHRFWYKDLYAATKGFKESEIIGVGGFGTVYKGVLQATGAEVAVKKDNIERYIERSRSCLN